MSNIYPSIILSISDIGNDIYNVVSSNNSFLRDNTYKRFNTSIKIDNNGVISSEDANESISIDLQTNQSKKENYNNSLRGSSAYINFIDDRIKSIFTFENQNYATNEGFSLKNPNLIILASIDDPILSPILLPLLLNLNKFPENTKPNVHIILMYNGKSNEEKLYKTTFLREFESFVIESGIARSDFFIWLLDVVNEDGFNFKNNENLYLSISKFIELLITNSAEISSLAFRDIDERGKPCIYSSFGYSLLTLPSSKIKTYLDLYSKSTEYQELSNSLEVKYEKIALQQELDNFFINSNFDSIPNKLGLDNNNEDIYEKFDFKYSKYVEDEKETALGESLTLIDGAGSVSSIFSSNFKSSFIKYKVGYEINELNNFGIKLDKAKKRVSDWALDIIETNSIELIDKKGLGLNYSRIFNYLLVNNESIVTDSLDGRPVDFQTLRSLEDRFRSLFIGDDILVLERELKKENDSYSHKKGMIEDSEEKVILINTSLEELEKRVGSDNPSFIAKTEEKDSIETQAIELKEDVGVHRLNIKNYVSKIQKIKSDFDRDTYKRDIKLKRNEGKSESIEEDFEEIEIIDKSLADSYEEKNSIIAKRKEHIFKKFTIIPIAILVVSTAILIALYFMLDSFNIKSFMYGLLAVFIIELVWGVYSVIEFLKINKLLGATSSDIKSTLNRKLDIFRRIIITNDNIYRNDFNFEKDLIAYNLCGNITSMMSSKLSNNDEFIDKIKSNYKEVKENLDKFNFVDNNLDFSVVEKNDIENIYDKYQPSFLINSDDGHKLSKYILEFNLNKNTSLLDDDIYVRVEELFNDRIKSVTIKELLFNEQLDFTTKIDASKKIEQIKNTSRPLLQADRAGNMVSNSDIAIVQNIPVGKLYDSYSRILNGFNISLQSGIEEENKHQFGILSVKSNFPAFTIFDVEENENLCREEIKEGELDKYYINDKSQKYSLLPSSNDGRVSQKSELDYDLILALSKKIISFDSKLKKFINKDVGSLGFTFEELIDNWNNTICYEIRQEVKQISEEINEDDNEEMNEYLLQFSEFFTEFKHLPKGIQKQIEVYYFSFIKGSEDTWMQIEKIIKKNRENN